MINILRDKTFSKLAHVYPHLEDIILHKKYALTINPQHQDKSLTCAYFDHQKLLNDGLAKYSVFELRPEFSTKSTKLHYHGTIEFTSSKALCSWYFHKIPELKEQCTFTIVPITDYDWYLYCIKQRHHMKPYFQSVNLPYKINNNTLQKIQL